MKSLIKYRVIFSSLIVFGAFATFAQNEWGNKVISFCQLLIAMTFVVDAFSILRSNIKSDYLKKFNIFVLSIVFISIVFVFLIDYIDDTSFEFIIFFVFLFSFLIITIESVIGYIRTKKNKDYNSGLFENYFFGLLFISLFLRNSFMPGGAALLLSSLLFLVPYVIIYAIRFFIKNKKKGVALTSLLSVGVFTTSLLGIFYLYKTLHYPGVEILFYLSFSFTILMILGSAKWKYKFNNETINILNALNLLRPNIIYIYFVAASICAYYYLEILNIAPKFYSQQLPSKVEKLYSENNQKSKEEAFELRMIYVDFVENTEKNWFKNKNK